MSRCSLCTLIESSVIVQCVHVAFTDQIQILFIQPHSPHLPPISNKYFFIPRPTVFLFMFYFCVLESMRSPFLCMLGLLPLTKSPPFLAHLLQMTGFHSSSCSIFFIVHVLFCFTLNWSDAIMVLSSNRPIGSQVGKLT